MRKIDLGQKRLSSKLSGQPKALSDFASSLMESTRSHVQLVATKLRTLRVEYKALTKQEKDLFVGKIRAVRRQLRQAEKEFRHAVALWDSTTRRLHKLIVVNSHFAPSAVAS